MKHYPFIRGRVFKDDSPFHHLPRHLDSAQRRYVEGVRYAIEMAHLSHTRLRDTLTSCSDQKIQGDFSEKLTHAILDAWSLVDSIHRLRMLLASTPKLNKRSPMLQVFSRGTDSVEPLRNHVQHLDGDLQNPEMAHIPVWGVIGWLWVEDMSFTRFWTHSMIAGPVLPDARPLLHPGDKSFHDQLDHITLALGHEQTNLSEAMRLTYRIGRSLERAMLEFLKHEALPDGSILSFRIQMNDEPYQPET